MEFTGLGGGIMLAIAAALWLVYLMPNWLRRREYLATERNAVRLQQTIRVLAETAEPPTAQPRRVAPSRMAQARVPQGPVAVGRPVTLPARPDPQLAAARRTRRTRAMASLVLLASIVVGVFSIAGAAWLLLGASAFTGVVSVALLGRLAEVSRNRRAPEARRAAPAFTDHQFEAPAAAPWTPVPVPKPMYLSRTVVEPAAGADPLEALRAAALASEEALRAAEPAAAPAPVPAESRPAARSRFASMGIVDAPAAAPDLDAVLARRRAG